MMDSLGRSPICDSNACELLGHEMTIAELGEALIAEICIAA